MTLAYNNKVGRKHVKDERDGRTDRQTDGQSATQYAAPSYGGGRRIKKRSERRKHCALAEVRRSQKISPRRRPCSRGPVSIRHSYGQEYQSIRFGITWLIIIWFPSPNRQMAGYADWRNKKWGQNIKSSNRPITSHDRTCSDVTASRPIIAVLLWL